MSAAELKPPPDLEAQVRCALQEDLGDGDRSASLVPEEVQARCALQCREEAVLCGAPWFECGFLLLSSQVRFDWLARDGDLLRAGQTACRLQGPARALLSGERTALNFLQLLSGTATVTRRFVHAAAAGTALLLDTRKTLPGLRSAQKYAVRCGGGRNHRMGLYDGVLLKENHLAAGGGTRALLERAACAGVDAQVEVESLEQLEEALNAGARFVLLDNFSLQQVRAAVEQAAGRAVLEVSGSVCLEQLPELATSGVDRISVGALTKHLRAVDFSLRLEVEERGPPPSGTA